MSSNLYKSFLALLKKWPIDESKKGRDLGEFIRQKITIYFPKADASTVTDFDQCNKKFQSLNRIASNTHSKRFPRIYNTTSTGLPPELSKIATSNEILEEYSK